jgi:ferredoxin-nitrate reductase
MKNIKEVDIYYNDEIDRFLGDMCNRIRLKSVLDRCTGIVIAIGTVPNIEIAKRGRECTWCSR